MLDPPLVLADEPTGNLDQAVSSDVFVLLRRLHAERGITFLVDTHDAHLAKRCDRRLTVLALTVQMLAALVVANTTG